MWKAAVSYSQGKSHLITGTPCQDFGTFLMPDDETIIGAVADGAGSSKHSDWGAECAVRCSLLFLKNRLNQIKANPEVLTDKLFNEMLQTIKATIEVFSNLSNREMKDHASTLLVVMATKRWLAACQIGDGFIATRWLDSPSYELLFTPDHGEYINETVFVTSSNSEDKMQTGLWKKSPGFIGMSSDGLERLAINLQSQKLHEPFLRPLDKLLFLYPSTETQVELQTFLDSEKINERTDDDKSLLLAVPSLSGN